MHRVASIVHDLLLRDLRALKREIDAFPDDAGPWRAHPGITNTSGTLALHCAGNIQHFIGARLAGSGYVRQRDLEFSGRYAPREQIIRELDHAIAAVERLDDQTASSLPTVFPDVFGGKQVNTDAMLVHLAVHLAYHLGQVDYHRRMVTGEGKTIDAVAASELPPAI
jgi:hypothetical protein